MSFSNITGRYYQTDTDEFPRSISWQQLLVLHIAANYRLRRCSMGWWADEHIFADGVVRVHSPATIKSLLKKGLLEGNARGVKIAMEGHDGRSTLEPPIPVLWIAAKGRKLLAKITSEAGIVFDRENYELVAPKTDGEAGEGIALGHFATELEAALAHDRAAILIYGEDAETTFPPEESEHVVLPDEVMRQINTVKQGVGGYNSLAQQQSGSAAGVRNSFLGAKNVDETAGGRAARLHSAGGG